jgi:AraC-like DNA-binding protein
VIEQFDYFVRVITIGAGLLLLAQIADGEVRPKLKVTLIGLLIGAIGYVINSSPALEPAGWADALVNFVALLVPLWAWLFARILFEREAPIRITQAAGAALVLSWFVGQFFPETRPVPFYINRVVSLVLIADLVRIAFADRADDLVEQRRTIRLVLPLLIGGQAAAVLLFEMIFGQTSDFPWAQLSMALLILVLVLFSGLALIQTDLVLLVQTQGDAPAEELVPELDLSPAEKVLHDKLTAAMDEGAYSASGLTIAALAERLSTPEHRLRALINQRLGHRNFSAFLNRYRIAEAQRMLSSSEHVDLPILTIAMDLGYNSLPPFNRAFRELTGSSPSEFRKRAFAEETSRPPTLEDDQN